jgi:lysophospholipase L1-like esterase
MVPVPGLRWLQFGQTASPLLSHHRFMGKSAEGSRQPGQVCWYVSDAPIRSTQKYRPTYDRLYSQIASWRQGKPTILRTINRYNDFIGWTDANLTPAQQRLTAFFVAQWDTMICKSAKANGFGCADLSKAFNGPDGMKPSGDLLADDYTHPSDKGNEVIARVLADLGYAPLA